MKRKSLIVVLCIALIAALCLSGCGQQSVMSKIEKNKAVIWGTNAEFMPFEGKDSSGNVIGIDAEIAAKIAEKMGVELKVEDMAFDSLPAALSSGKIDFIGAGFTADEERLKTMDFTDPYYTACQIVLVQEGNTDITSKDALKGKKIGVQNSTTGDVKVASLIEGADVQRYDSVQLAAQDLANGKIDAVIADNLPSLLLVKNIAGLKVVDGITYEDEHYGLAVKKGETELLKKLNEVIKEMIDNGEIDALVDKYNGME